MQYQGSVATGLKMKVTLITALSLSWTFLAQVLQGNLRLLVLLYVIMLVSVYYTRSQ